MPEINPLLKRAPTRPSGFMKAFENAKAGAGSVETAKVGVLGKSGLKAAFERARAAAAESVPVESDQAASVPKAFRMIKEAAAEAEAVAATQVISRLRPRRVNTMPELSQDAPKETPTPVEATVLEVTLPPAQEPEKDTPKAVTPRMRLIVVMETPPAKERLPPEPQRIVELVRHDGCERVYRILTRCV
jgi:hypothetical protein